MIITVNKNILTIPDKITIVQLLNLLNYTQSVAIFVNGKQLLQAQYIDYELEENDNVRIVKPLGGG